MDDGKFAGAIDGDVEVKLALGSLDFGDVDVDVADRIGFELLPYRLVASDLRQPRDAMTLQAAMQLRVGQMRDRRLQGVEAIVEREHHMPSEGNDDGFVLH